MIGDIRRNALGSDHVDVAADIAALAALLDGQGKFDEAEPLYRQALEAWNASTVPNTIRCCQPQQPRGQSTNPRRSVQAERLYVRALEIKEKLLGTGAPRSRVDAEQPGGVQQKTGPLPGSGRDVSSRAEYPRKDAQIRITPKL